MSASVSPCSFKNDVATSLQLRCNELGDVARKYRFEAFAGDIPAHDVERIGPRELAATDDRRSVAAAREQRRGGPVAEERRRDDVALGKIVAAKTERAELDDEEEHERAGIRARHRRRALQADGASCATEAENRQAPSRAAQLHALHQKRVEARRRDARRGYGDDGSRSPRGCAARGECLARRPLRADRAPNRDRRGFARANREDLRTTRSVRDE